MAESHSPVLYANRDYASGVRRLISVVIDVGVLISFLLFAYSIVVALVVPDEVKTMPRSTPAQRRESDRLTSKAVQPYSWLIAGPWILTSLVYILLLRRTRGGPLGYRLTRIRLIDVSGEPPSWPTLFKRTVIGVPLIWFFGIAYVACFLSPRRQAAHDQFAGTWVVRCRAKPVGPAQVIFQTKFFGTYPLTFRDVEALAAPTSETVSADLSV